MAGVAIRPRTPFESSKTSPVVVLVRVDMVGRDKDGFGRALGIKSMWAVRRQRGLNEAAYSTMRDASRPRHGRG